MKFLTFVDIHEDTPVLKELVKRAAQDDVDFVICAGDFTTFGRGMRTFLEAFDKIGKKLYLIPGNHEEREGLLDLVAEFPHAVNLHRQAIKINKYIFLGYGGGGFAQEDSQFRKLAREWYGKYKGQKIVLVTHGPQFGTTLDLLGNRHVGNKDYRQWIERLQPKLVIAGHLHETAGATDIIGKTKLVNPGWEGMVIELK
ncbi:MAG TPA: metallophosphoesterase [Candidatus Nanoarchaeia archaeon]|nr:metallophosphoesterase [Candidatus Nanoarchaeia archaeon]